MVFHWRVALCSTHLQAGSMLGFGEPCSFGEEQQLRREEKFKLLSLLRKEGRKEMFYLTPHSTHFIYGYMASDIWLRTILIVRERKPAAAIRATLSN